MTLSDRDKKLLIFLVPIVVLAAYWLLLLGPKREEASKLGDQLATQEQKRDSLQTQASQLGKARDDFAADYATVLELGKAVPTSVDMAGLMVQLERAAHGTGIAFERIHADARLPADSTSSSTASSSSQSGTPAVAAGGEKASTGPGTAVEKANDTKAQQDSAAGASSGASSGSSSAATGQTSGAPGLDAIPLEFTFRGSFVDLADFFHRMKRFVHVVNDRVDARGRLMTVDGFEFKTSAFPRLEATVNAKVYLAPKKEGATGGATPAGPAPDAGSQQASAPPSSAPPAAVIGR